MCTICSINAWHDPIYRSSHPEVLIGKGALEIRSKFIGEHPCRSVISVKLLWNFIEIALWHGCSPVNLLHIFRTPFHNNCKYDCLYNKCWNMGLRWMYLFHTCMIKNSVIDWGKKLHMECYIKKAGMMSFAITTTFKNVDSFLKLHIYSFNGSNVSFRKIFVNERHYFYLIKIIHRQKLKVSQ